jgi:hypothetical protein
MGWSWEEDDMHPNDLPHPINRTSGEMPCEFCRRPLYKHYQPMTQTCPTLVVDCYQRFWKL